MDCCGLLTPGYVRLLDICYPSSKVLGSTNASDIKPSSNELGRLSFLCTNAPASKLAKVTAALEKKVSKQARNAHRNPKSKAALCVSLDILKRLIEDCRQMLTAAAPHALAILSAALTVPDTSGSASGYSASGGSWDLSIVERVASTFASFAAFADGSWLGLDPDVCTSYLSLLSTLANIAVQPYEKNAANATSLRMLGLYALSASFSADAFDNTEPERQIDIAMPALLANLTLPSASITILNEELAHCEERATGSAVKEIRPSQRIPLEKRKARSFRSEHHGELEKQKESHAVVCQTLADLRLLLQRGRARQVEQVVSATVAWLDKHEEHWNNPERCCWLAQTFTQLSQIQYRFVVITVLLEALTSTPPQPSPSHKQITLLSMMTAVLTGPTALLALGLGDILSSFLAIITRRAQYGPQDPFLPALINSTSSLATRVYYLDQITDLVQDLINVLRKLPKPSADVPALERTTQCTAILQCLIGVLQSSQSSLTSDSEATRSHVQPAVWTRSLFLWTDTDSAIRFTYSHALLLYIKSELSAMAASDAGTRSPHTDQTDRKEFFDALALAAYRLALAHFTLVPPSTSSASSQHSPHSDGAMSPKTSAATGVSTVDDFSAIEEVLVAALQTGIPQAVLSILPMLSALLTASHIGLPSDNNAACREVINTVMRSALHIWAEDNAGAPGPIASHLPPLRPLKEGLSGQTLSSLNLQNAAPSNMEFPSIEDLSKSSKLQMATGLEGVPLLASLKEPWSTVKAAQKNMGMRVRPISSAPSVSRLRSPSQASFRSPSVSDLRASLTSPAMLLGHAMENVQDQTITLNRRSLRVGVNGKVTEPASVPTVPDSVSESTGTSKISSPTKPSPLRT